MTDQPKIKGYLDQDTTDEWMDKEPIRYADGSSPTDGMAERLADPEYVKTLPKIPPSDDD